jgi:hypothetical protein
MDAFTTPPSSPARKGGDGQITPQTIAAVVRAAEDSNDCITVVVGSAALYLHGIWSKPNDVDVLVTAEKGARLAMTGGVLTTEDPFTSSGATFSVLGVSVDLIKTRSTGRFKALEVDGVVVRVATLKWLLDEYKEVVADGLGDKVEAAKAKIEAIQSRM